jgi:hypothetical protein
LVKLLVKTSRTSKTKIVKRGKRVIVEIRRRTIEERKNWKYY